MHSQKVKQSKLQRNATKIDDKPVKDSHRMKDNTNICENNTKPTIIRDTKNELKALKNVNPIESCADEDINLTYVDSDTEMFDTFNINSVKSWKVKKENRKLKRKHSQIDNSIISIKYFNSLSTRSLVSDNSFGSYFQKQNAQKRNMSFKDYIPKVGNNLTSDDDEWMVEEVLRSDSKEISTDADENTPRAKYERNKRTNIEGSRNIDLSVPDLKVTAESSEHSKNCISNFGESSNKSNERKNSMNLKFVQKSSKSGPHAKRNYNRTLQRENNKDVSVTKVTNSTGVLNISEMENVASVIENVASVIENTVDDKIKYDKTNIVCQSQSTNDNGAKYSRLSSKLTPESKKTNLRKGEVLKIQSINFEKEPLLIKTATLLKEEEGFKTIHETKNIFDMLYQTAATAGNETSLTNQIESMDSLESSSSNCRNGQYSKSDVNLLKVWDSKSSKLPVLPNRLKTARLNAGNDRKTLVVNCCRLENNLSNSYSLQSSECTGSITNSDTKMKPNFACKGKLKDNYVSPKDRRINKKVCFSLDNDEEEASSRKSRKLKIRVNESNYKYRDSKTISAVKTTKSGRISKKLFNINEEFTHKDSRIKKSDSSTRTSTSKNLDFHEGIMHVDVVSDASSNDNKSTSKVNHSNTERTSRRQKKRPPLICEYCSKQFTKPSQLLYHTRSHTGERPFKCDVCDKAFVSNSHLLRHSRTHSSVKSHICDTCGRGFSQRYSLMTHENIHSGIKSFKCQKCSVTFRTHESLVKHERKH
uniref:C2H2-type domain-containing protein n=1 Tax=Octopus bimaculoides TaxID=37653 RepID=A0A0L8H4Y4_OCTBM